MYYKLYLYIVSYSLYYLSYPYVRMVLYSYSVFMDFLIQNVMLRQMLLGKNATDTYFN